MGKQRMPQGERLTRRQISARQRAARDLSTSMTDPAPPETEAELQASDRPEAGTEAPVAETAQAEVETAEMDFAETAEVESTESSEVEAAPPGETEAVAEAEEGVPAEDAPAVEDTAEPEPVAFQAETESEPSAEAAPVSEAVEPEPETAAIADQFTSALDQPEPEAEPEAARAPEAEAEPETPLAAASVAAALEVPDALVTAVSPARPVKHLHLRLLLTPVRIDIQGIGTTLANYVHNESAAALSHMQALTAAKSPADMIRLQVTEMQRAADASLTCWNDIALKATRPVLDR